MKTRVRLEEIHILVNVEGISPKTKKPAPGAATVATGTVERSFKLMRIDSLEDATRLVEMRFAGVSWELHLEASAEGFASYINETYSTIAEFDFILMAIMFADYCEECENGDK